MLFRVHTFVLTGILLWSFVHMSEPQCDNIPTENTLLLLQPTEFIFLPSDHLKPWLSCSWNFKGPSNMPILISISYIKTGPMSSLVLIDDNEVILNYKTIHPRPRQLDTVITNCSSVRLNFTSGFAAISKGGFYLQMIAGQHTEAMKNRYMRATPDEQFLTSPGFPELYEDGTERRWFVTTDDCATGIQIVILLTDVTHQCHASLILDTQVKTVNLSLTKAFKPMEFHSFISPGIEIVLRHHTETCRTRFVLKFRSNTRTRLKPMENVAWYLGKQEDPEGFEARYIDTFKGRGIFATWPFQQGDFIMMYTLKQAVQQRQEGIYAFQFDSNGTTWWVNADEDDGTFGRLINDNVQSPNAATNILTVPDGKPYVFFLALRDIDLYEEITFNYGHAPWPWRTKEDDSFFENHIFKATEVVDGRMFT